MPIKNLTQGTAFTVGMVGGILLFIGLNFYSMSAHWRGVDQWGTPGIPFPFINGTGNLFRVVSIAGLFADTAFALCVSFCIGVATKSVWKEISN
jgi:hypothetical protein